MFRKLALAGAMVAAVALAALAATPLHTYNNSVGQEQETIGVHCINNTTGEPESCGTGGSSTISSPVGAGTSAAAVRVVLATDQPSLTNAQPVNLASTTTGGCTPYHLLSAANTNPTNVKNSAATLCSLAVINTTATIYYLKFYNQTAAPSTCATDAANVVLNIPIPASASGAGVAPPLGSFGVAFSAGLSFCLTGAQADNDTTNAATGVNINLAYK